MKLAKLKKIPQSFWAFTPKELLNKLTVKENEGLDNSEAKKRLKTFGNNILKPQKKFVALRLLLAQFNTPFIYLLIFAAVLSFILEDNNDAFIILIILIVSGLLSFFQERGALQAIQKLLKIVQIKIEVIRNHQKQQISIEEVVPGDIVNLKAGDIIPGDCSILEAKNLLVDESTLTGESFSIEKSPGKIDQNTPLAKRTNSLFMGTHVQSGEGKALVVLTGKNTEFGKISAELEKKTPETEFDKGVRLFGYFLMKVTVILLAFIFGFNVFMGEKPFVESLLFALALSVGLTPQLLPAIITINLAHGAKKMAKQKVIIKKLSSIENFGSMNILCTDKTGTLTTGKIKLEKALNVHGDEDESVFLYAYLNAINQTSYNNTIDQAIVVYKKLDTTGWNKIDEIPYTFEKKRMSVLVKKEKSKVMITKGAFQQIIEICSHARRSGSIVKIDKISEDLNKQFEELNQSGYRVLAIAYRDDVISLKPKEESQMVFLGFLLFMDPPKPDIESSIATLRKLGISLKIITGDNQFAAIHVAKILKISPKKIMVGPEIINMSDDELLKQIQEKEIFAEIEPNQKKRIILALRQANNVVGYLGDGINDVTALHAADVSIAVDSGADVTKEVADIVLLEKDLKVLRDGIKEGRRTFANTLKYIFMATSANFGNMFSMAGASLFLNFLPLLPKQVLLTNLMTDFPEMTIATDNVDRAFIEKPLRWNIHFIRKFMSVFGLISSIFDYATFGVLLFVLNASTDQFRTAWFVESVASATLIVLVIRTFKPFYTNMPSKYLLFTVISIFLISFYLPISAAAHYFGLVAIPFKFYVCIVIIISLYVLSVEFAKKIFLKGWLKELKKHHDANDFETSE